MVDLNPLTLNLIELRPSSDMDSKSKIPKSGSRLQVTILVRGEIVASFDPVLLKVIVPNIVVEDSLLSPHETDKKERPAKIKVLRTVAFIFNSAFDVFMVREEHNPRHRYHQNCASKMNVVIESSLIP